MGRVVRVLTTFWTCCRPSSSFSFATLNFIMTVYDVKLWVLFGNSNLSNAGQVLHGGLVRRQVRQSDGLVPWRLCSCGSRNRKLETHHLKLNAEGNCQ